MHSSLEYLYTKVLIDPIKCLSFQVQVQDSVTQVLPVRVSSPTASNIPSNQVFFHLTSINPSYLNWCEYFMYCGEIHGVLLVLLALTV